MANYEVLQETAFLLLVAEQHEMYKLSVAQGTPGSKYTKPDKETQDDPNNPTTEWSIKRCREQEQEQEEQLAYDEYVKTSQYS